MVKSMNGESIEYKAVSRAPRKGSAEVLVGHEWRCLLCNAMFHEEPRLEVDDDEGHAARHIRVREACEKHIGECKERKAE